MSTNSKKEEPRGVEILSGILTEFEANELMSFMESKLSNNSMLVGLKYRPDEWDSSGVIQKVYETAKEYIKENYNVHGQLEPKQFTISRVIDSIDVGEEYGDYNANGEILYAATVALPSAEGCSGGDSIYVVTNTTVRLADSSICIHRCEAINNWRISNIRSGSRLNLVILFREISREISYDYDIDQTIEDLLD